MRTYRVQINGREYTTSVDQKGDGTFQVTVDGEVFESEPLTKGNISTWRVRSAEDSINAQTRVLPTDKVDVWLAGTPFQASVQAIGAGGYTIPTQGIGRSHLSGDICAPMPGRITSILVKEGESVDVGTPLLILEAMKMQNEIVSPVAGKVKSILIEEGVVIKKEAVLVIVK
ncbi:MAG: biotin/lipoyl-containing protein [Candidatus Bathyarchaeia archaeon]